MSTPAKYVPAKAPEKGSFPLDHFHECTLIQREYMQCLKENNNEGACCRAIAKRYMECRMETGLMAKEDLKQLGFKENETNKIKTTKEEEEGDNNDQQEKNKYEKGFVAGMNRKKLYAKQKEKEKEKEKDEQ